VSSRGLDKAKPTDYYRDGLRRAPSNNKLAAGVPVVADDHPNIANRDWRLRAITTLAQEFRSPTGKVHPVGTPIEWVGFMLLSGGGGLNIPVPDPAAIYLSLAEMELQKAIEYQKNILPSVIQFEPYGEHKLNPGAEAAFFDCLQSLIAAVVFSYTSIEVFANSMIPDEYSFSAERNDKRCVESYSKEQIERHISLDTKLDKVLPQVCSVGSPKGTRLWSQYMKIKELRDRLIHLKSTDWQPSTPEKAKDFVWTWLFSAETKRVSAFAFDIIWHYLPAEKPRWALRFQQAIGR
jgi:hypothetical protein